MSNQPQEPVQPTASPDQAAPHAEPAVSGRTFASTVIAHFVVDCFGGIWPIYKTLAGLDLAIAGGIATAVSMLSTATQPFFGLWADRSQQRRRFVVLGMLMTFAAMLLGPLIWLIGEPIFAPRPAGTEHSLEPLKVIGRTGAVIPMSTAYVLMFAVMLFVRLGQDMYHPSGAGLAGSFRPQRRSLFVAIFIAVGSTGFALSQSLFSLVYTWCGRHTELLLIPGAAALLLVAAWCWPSIAPGRQAVTLRGVFKDMRPAWFHLLVLFWILALSAGVNIGFYFLLPELMQARGYPGWMVKGGAYAFFIFGSVFMMIPAGHVAERFGRRRMLIVVLALSVASYFAVVLLPPLPVVGFLAICLLAGGFMGTTNPLGIAFGQHLSPRNVSMTSALMMGAAWCVGSVTPSIVGPIAKRLHSPVETLAWLGTINFVTLALAFMLPGRSRENAVRD